MGSIQRRIPFKISILYVKETYMKKGTIPEGELEPLMYGTLDPPWYRPDDDLGVPLPSLVLPPLLDLELVRPTNASALVEKEPRMQPRGLHPPDPPLAAPLPQPPIPPLPPPFRRK